MSEIALKINGNLMIERTQKVSDLNRLAGHKMHPAFHRRIGTGLSAFGLLYFFSLHGVIPPQRIFMNRGGERQLTIPVTVYNLHTKHNMFRLIPSYAFRTSLTET